MMRYGNTDGGLRITIVIIEVIRVMYPLQPYVWACQICCKSVHEDDGCPFFMLFFSIFLFIFRLLVNLVKCQDLMDVGMTKVILCYGSPIGSVAGLITLASPDIKGSILEAFSVIDVAIGSIQEMLLTLG